LQALNPWRMKIYNGIHNCPVFRNPVVTIGIFDGVHKGHREILECLKLKAIQHQGESVVITLWPHPRMILQPGTNNLKLLSTLEEKEHLLHDAGIDNLLILPFTMDFAALEPCDFIRQYLVEGIGVAHLVIGFDHHFGRNREGNYQKITECACKSGFTVEKLDAITTTHGVLSSTFIRTLLEEGRLDEANQALGYDYTLTGKVVGGSRLGRTIGYPTANIEPSESWKLVPSVGVYAVDLMLGEEKLKGMLNIGFKPTVSSGESVRTIEVHIFDFDRDLYGKNLNLAFRKKMRNEKRFLNLEELKEQLVRDEQEARQVLGKY
jgi:riboflavin kinase / FMN adenylyltransferase